MGFDDGRMTLDSPNGVYYSGQIIRGNLIFQQDKIKTFRGIYLKIKGFCKVHWTTTETRRVNGKSQTYRKSHDSYEEYINNKIFLVGGESGEHQIQPGNYDYPFSFQLPAGCPSSFEGSYGHVRYEIKAVVDRAFKLDQEKKVAVRVMCPMDLNAIPSCRDPIEMEFNDTYCCCCFRSGAVDTVVKIPLSGYCPGQTIPIDVQCMNKGNVGISRISLRIIKKVTFIATNHPGQRHDKEEIAKIKKGPIPGNTTRMWSVDMEIPALDIYNMIGCRYIDLEYKFGVVIAPDGCHNNSKESRNIIFGTIPLVGFQDNIQNPLHEQMPQIVAPITQQPFPNPAGYPTPANYPTSPYPNTPQNPPYQNTPQVPPYPNTPQIPPYQNTPQIPPYPISSPYPASNPVLDTSKSPYPPSFPNPTNASYPGSPNTITNPPYPVVNSPYPDNPPPYPGNPYPPGNMGGSLLRTGNIGFTVQGNTGYMNVSPGATATNSASPVPVDPFVTASAPVLESPNNEKQKGN